MKSEIYSKKQKRASRKLMAERKHNDQSWRNNGLMVQSLMRSPARTRQKKG